MELTTHKLRISQSTVNTILSRAQGHYKSILLSAGADNDLQNQEPGMSMVRGSRPFLLYRQVWERRQFLPSLRLPQRSRSSDENQEFRLR